MSLPITLRPGAEADLEDAYLWYKERLSGLGDGFLRAVDVCLARMQRYPEAYPEVYPHVRRAPLSHFPYGVFYVIRQTELDVLAIYHARRHPRGAR